MRSINAYRFYKRYCKNLNKKGIFFYVNIFYIGIIYLAFFVPLLK
ncbi:hypothetical protein LCGC14_1164770 [marine sediment metagenome]|uniref:Uncharacterized protein n=1 Tax=marine sediment metagenome TaxID=412755 RepID=A0A0F9PX80_9ZZZZ